MLRIGLLTSGGDCQALNATMRGIVKTLMTNSEEPIEIYGFEDGYQGLPSDCLVLGAGMGVEDIGDCGGALFTMA